MAYENAQFTDLGSTTIRTMVGDVELHIPADPSNRHYRKLVASGVTIANYVPPVETPEDMTAKTELPGAMAKTLEDVIANLADGTPLPARTLKWPRTGTPDDRIQQRSPPRHRDIANNGAPHRIQRAH